ncbi:alpha/beta hydrolase [Deinococcus gobiensis]|uniref:alpha/beta hydrolase n=1 Tax=Deinococcus gobiensis TaxID=502394 RepID=UPI0011AE5EDB|nr:alpha/beta hydrolase [Deinococcus gobiensis]
MNRTLATLPLLSGLMLLGACSTTSTPDPLATYTGQQLNWTSCDPTLVPYRQVIKAVGSRIECADVQVPLDWNKPDRGTMSFSMLRVKAGDAAARKGAIFFNPGGPGGDGLLFGAIYGYLWNQADTTTPAGKALKALADGYDLVGFSPRGTGQSSRYTCGSNELASPEQYPSEDRSQTNIDAMLRNARLVAQSCLKNPITPYINTDQTARDLNLARQLMGDAKLNYVGYSYGTWLGSWYARRFPESTGRLLLDGNTAFAGTFQDSFNLQPLGFERAFREVALAYAARHDDVFGLGKTAADVYAVYNAFPGALKFTLQQYSSSNIIQNLYSNQSIPNISLQLVAARGFAAVIKANPEVKDNASLAELVAKQTYSGVPKLNAAAQQEALTMVDTYLAIVNGLTGPVELSYGSAVFNAILNNDTAWEKDPQKWVEFGNQEAKSHPLIGGSYTETSAIYWPAPSASRPDVPANLPPILMLQNEYDPATPAEGALAALKAFPSAKMLFVDDEAQHTAFPYGTDCVDLQVAQYFLNGTMPAQKFNVCGALPLPGEEQVYPVGKTYAGTDNLSAQGLHRAALGATPETKAELQLLKDIIKRNGLKANSLR